MALFRRGEAHLAVNDFDLARADFQKVLQLYPSNKAAKAQLVVCQQRIRKQLEKEKKLYANMFERLAEEETKVRMGRVDGRRCHHLVPCQSVCIPVCCPCSGPAKGGAQPRALKVRLIQSSCLMGSDQCVQVH